jgi:antitoxin YefM
LNVRYNGCLKQSIGDHLIEEKNNMRRTRLDRDIRPVTEFRENAASLIRQVQDTKRALVLTQRGHSAAVLLDVGEYEKLVGELELRRRIEAAEKAIARGEEIPHEEVEERVLELAQHLDRDR